MWEVLVNNAYVTAEGYLIACCQDFENNLVMADLNHEDIAIAWNNEMFTEFRRKYLNRELDGTLCYNCLNRTSEPVKPWIQEFGGYEESVKKRVALDQRIIEIVRKGHS